MQMICRMLAHEVDERDFRTSCIVEIGETIAEARSEMKQSACRFAGHPCVAVCCTRSHTFKKPEHATHLGNSVERGNNVYFGGAGVRKTGIHAPSHQRPYQAFRSIHANLLFVSPGFDSNIARLRFGQSSLRQS